MPYADYGEEVSFGGGQFLQLKNKGDKVTIRFVGKPYYEGLHFIKQDGKFIKSYCPRIMEKQDCQYCEKAQELYNEAKNASEADKKRLEDEMRQYRAAIKFYFPVLDRSDGKAKLFQTTLSVRNAIETEIKAGVKVLEHDYVIVRAQLDPAHYYSVIRMDSKDTKDLTDNELTEIDRAGSFDVPKMLGGKPAKESSIEMEDEPQ